VSAEPAIRLEHASYTYPGAAVPALRDVSLTLPAGQFCAVVGASGAGKSTLALALAGFVPHFYHGRLEGRVMVGGRDTRAAALSELVQIAGLVLQNPFNQISGTRYTVREEIAFGLENLGVPPAEMPARIEAVLDVAGIADLAERSPLALSGGQMQRVALAAVLAMRPPILVLDEPTAQLDPVGSREVFAAVQALAARGGTTVVLIEHKLEWIGRFADRVVVLAEGMVAADGPPAEVLADERLAAWGVGHTRYTQAARRAQVLGLWPAGRPLPVTLEQAAAGFGSG
jgi:energy-coupling factor transporter ATP-binding protein EcfA2